MTTTPASRTYSDFLHVPIALGLMLAAFLLSRWSIVAASAFCGVFACFYREVTQEEYRWIAANGGLRAAMPRFQGLYVWQWNKHSLLETLYAGVACALLAFGLMHL